MNREQVISDAALRAAIEWAEEHPEDSPVPPIERGLSPGGLVIRLLIDGSVRHETKGGAVDGLDHIPVLAHEAADLAVDALEAGKHVELRVYDGDSGGWVFSRQVLTR